MKDLDSYKLATIVARILDNKKAKDITILNIANVSVLADYFVICSADASTQVRALTQGVKLKVKELYERMPSSDECDSKNRWNLLDYGDVVVHILHSEERELYAIEKFWNHGLTVSPEQWLGETEDMVDELR